MNLKDFTKIINLNEKYHKFKLKMKAFHATNMMILFISNTVNNHPFMLQCNNLYLNKNKLFVRLYAHKTLLEFMAELFYFNKSSHYAYGYKKKPILKLIKMNDLKYVWSKKHHLVSNVYTIINEKDDKKRFHKLLKVINNFNNLYAQIAKNPDKFFKVKTPSKAQISRIKRVIKEKYFLSKRNNKKSQKKSNGGTKNG